MLIIKLLRLITQALSGSYCDEIHRSPIKSTDNVRSLEIDIFLGFAFRLHLGQEVIVIRVRPRIEKGEEDLLIRGECVLEAPLNPPFVELLSHPICTILFKSIL
jgi:hypothetical protein